MAEPPGKRVKYTGFSLLSPGEGNGNPLQSSCLKNSMDRGTCRLKSMRSQELDMT